MGNAEKIQIVMNTLATLHMPATFENCNSLLGIYATLTEVRDDLARTGAAAQAEEEDDGREAAAE